MNTSVALQAPIELINITPFNPLISKVQIKVCWVGNEPNRNKSIITKEVATELANSLPGSPIVGYYNEESEDFEAHNKVIELRNGQFRLKSTTQPYGFVDLAAKVWFQTFIDFDGVAREYLCTEGWLWTGQFPECQRVIAQGNHQSMELDEHLIDAYWTKDVNGKKQFFIINEAIISKLCILGEDAQPAFEGANITAPKVEFSLEDDFKEKMFSMMTEIKNILEGGAPMINEDGIVVEEPVVEEEPTPAVEEPVVEEPVPNEFADEENKEEEEKEEEICPECGKPVSECECEEEKEEDDKKDYNLDEIPEYAELKANYDELEGKFNTLTTDFEALEAEVTGLREFKTGIEKKEKEAMIARFYMLSDEDKKEVIDNIDTYSLEDIESKLSILCVRNKVSFADPGDNDNNPTVYSLNDGNPSGNADKPEWIKALQEVAKTF